MGQVVGIKHVTGLCRRKRLRALGGSIKGLAPSGGSCCPLDHIQWFDDPVTPAYPDTERTRVILERYEAVVPVNIPIKYPSYTENPFHADSSSYSTSYNCIPLNDQTGRSPPFFKTGNRDGIPDCFEYALSALYLDEFFGLNPLNESDVYDDLDFLSDEYERNKDIEFYVSIDIDDSASSGAQITVTLKSYKAYKAGDETGDLLLDTSANVDMDDADISHKILDSGEFGATKGITKGDTADYGQVWYEINTLSLDKVTTHFILPEDGSKTYMAENESLRYVGEDRYYTVVMNIDNDHQEMVIVPESVFYDSELGDILLDEEMSDDQKKTKFEDWDLSGLRFSSADEDKVELSRYLKGVWVIDITATQIDDIILHLTVNKTGETPYEDIEVEDQIWTFGLPDELLELTPTISPKLSPLSQLTIVEREIALIDEWVEETDNVLVSAIWGWVKEPITQLVKVTKETINLVVTLGEAILSGNPGAAMQALEDIGNFVWRGIVSFAQNPLEFYAKISAIFVALALCGLMIWLEYISTVGELIVAGLTMFLTFVYGQIKQLIYTLTKPFWDAHGEWKSSLILSIDGASESGISQGCYNVLPVLRTIFSGKLYTYLLAFAVGLQVIFGLIQLIVKLSGAGAAVDQASGTAMEAITKQAAPLGVKAGKMIGISYGLTALTILFLEIAFLFIPEDDPFFSSGWGATLFGLILFLNNFIINRQAGTPLGKMDAWGLFIVAIGVMISFISMDYGSTNEGLLFTILGLVFTVFGAYLTIITSDFVDLTFGGILSKLEELISVLTAIFIGGEIILSYILPGDSG